MTEIVWCLGDLVEARVDTLGTSRELIDNCLKSLWTVEKID